MFYLDDSGNLCEAELSLRNGDLSVGNATVLFRSDNTTLSGQGLTYDVTPDGRFIVNTLSQENQTEIVVVSNWNAKLKK